MQTGEETELLQLTEDLTGISTPYNAFENINILGNHIYFVIPTDGVIIFNGEAHSTTLKALLTMTTDGENITQVCREEY